jgi:hypothetical protein
LRLVARGTQPALGVFLLSTVAAISAALLAPAADALPVAVLSTGGCTTSATNNIQTCQQTGGLGDIFSQANLDNLSATASLNAGPYAFTAQASVIYYFSITSPTGPVYDWIPLTVTGNGNTSVGNSGSATGATGFNNNTASADIRINSYSVFSACSGYGCNGPSSFSGSRTAWVQPYSPGVDSPSVLQVSLDARVTTNSNYERSSAYAFVDPIIQIEAAYLAAHPGLTLSFSEGVPAVPLPGSLWLMAGGMLGLVEARRRQRQ